MSAFDTLGQLLGLAGRPLGTVMDVLSATQDALAGAQAHGRARADQPIVGTPIGPMPAFSMHGPTGLEAGLTGAPTFAADVLQHGWDDAVRRSRELAAQQPDVYPAEKLIQSLAPNFLPGPAAALNPVALAKAGAALGGARTAAAFAKAEPLLHAGLMGGIGADLVSHKLDQHGDDAERNRGLATALALASRGKVPPGVGAALLGAQLGGAVQQVASGDETADATPGAVLGALAATLARKPIMRDINTQNEYSQTQQERAKRVAAMQQFTAAAGGDLTDQAVQQTVKKYVARAGNYFNGTHVQDALDELRARANPGFVGPNAPPAGPGPAPTSNTPAPPVPPSSPAPVAAGLGAGRTPAPAVPVAPAAAQWEGLTLQEMRDAAHPDQWAFTPGPNANPALADDAARKVQALREIEHHLTAGTKTDVKGEPLADYAARVQPMIVQDLLKLGWEPDWQAMGSQSATPIENAPGSPSAAPTLPSDVDAALPSWARQVMDNAALMADHLGITDQILDMARRGVVAKDIRRALASKLGSMPSSDAISMIRAVRSKAGIARADTEDFRLSQENAPGSPSADPTSDLPVETPPTTPNLGTRWFDSFYTRKTPDDIDNHLIDVLMNRDIPTGELVMTPNTTAIPPSKARAFTRMVMADLKNNPDHSAPAAFAQLQQARDAFLAGNGFDRTPEQNDALIHQMRDALTAIDAEGLKVRGPKEMATPLASPSPERLPEETQPLPPPPDELQSVLPKTVGAARALQRFTDWVGYAGSMTNPVAAKQQLERLHRQLTDQSAERGKNRVARPTPQNRSFEDAYQQLRADNPGQDLAETINSGDFAAHLRDQDYPWVRSDRMRKQFQSYIEQRTFGGDYEAKLTSAEKTEADAYGKLWQYFDQKTPTGGDLDMAAGGGGGLGIVAPDPLKTSQQFFRNVFKLMSEPHETLRGTSAPGIGQVGPAEAEAAAQALPHVYAAVPRVNAMRAQATQLRDWLSQIPDAGIDANSSAADVLKAASRGDVQRALVPFIAPKRLERVTRRMRDLEVTGGGHDLLTGDPDELLHHVGAVQSMQAQGYDFAGQRQGAIGRTLQKAAAFNKAMYLMSAHFLAQSGTENRIKNALEGYPVHLSDANLRQAMSDYGLSALPSVVEQGDRVPGQARQWVHNLPGIGGLSRGFTNANEIATERPTRGAVFVTAMDRAVRSDLPDFMSRVDQLAQQTGFDPTPIWDLANATKGRFDPKQLEAALQQAGVVEQSRNTLLRDWSGLIEDAKQHASAETGRIHIDYGYQTKADEKASYAVPFSTWASRNAPYQLDYLAKHPNLWAALSSSDDRNRVAEQQAGQPERLDNMAPVLGGPIAQTLYGRPGEGYVDPTNLLALRGQVREAYSPRDNTGLGRVLDAAGQFGINPWIGYTAPLQAAGLLGDRPFTTQYPIDRLLEKTTGLNPEAPALAVLNDLQSKLTGREHPNVTGNAQLDALVRRRIGELAAEPGAGDAADYEAARNDPSSPIFKRALADAQQQFKGEGLVGFVSPLAIKFQSSTERQIHQQQANGTEEPAAALLPHRLTPEEQVAQQQYDRTYAEWRRGRPHANRRQFERALQRDPELAARAGKQAA